MRGNLKRPSRVARRVHHGRRCCPMSSKTNWTKSLRKEAIGAKTVDEHLLMEFTIAAPNPDGYCSTITTGFKPGLRKIRIPDHYSFRYILKYPLQNQRLLASVRNMEKMVSGR